LAPGVINIMPLSGQGEILHAKGFIFISNRHTPEKHYNLDVSKISKNNN
jgi:hypothetical protein